jgi:hypothetical protein
MKHQSENDVKDSNRQYRVKRKVAGGFACAPGWLPLVFFDCHIYLNLECLICLFVHGLQDGFEIGENGFRCESFHPVEAGS